MSPKLRDGENALVFAVQEAPDTKRGTEASDRPPSFR